MKLRNKKTGEIKSIEEIIRDAFLSNELDSLKSIDTNWEDVDVTNATNIPIIKDEKVRKAVRAWADVQGIKEVKYIEGIASSDFRHMFEYGSRGTNRGIIHWGYGILLYGLEDGKTYSITELCGEEEE